MEKLQKTKRLIAFVDKEFPPHHSFVTGMLAKAFPDHTEYKVTIVCSESEEGKGVYKYHHAALVAKLLPRRGVQRFLNFFHAYGLLKALLKKYKNDDCVIFVRNGPLYMLAAELLKGQRKFIFQNSFPHDFEPKPLEFKKWFARFIYRATKPDEILVVSDQAIPRARKSFKRDDFHTIPLLNDFPVISKQTIQTLDKIKFLYIGTHAEMRKMDFVFKVFKKLDEAGKDFEFHTYGGSPADLERLNQDSNYKALKEKGKAEMRGPVNREKIPEIMSGYQVGLSLIPPIKMYEELSPTKLSEYMARGNAIIATQGIKIQDKLLTESGAGHLTPYSFDEVYTCFLNVINNPGSLTEMRLKGIDYVNKVWNYPNYVQKLLKVVSP